MNISALTPATRWLRTAILLLTIAAGSGHAAIYGGTWDPSYGAPFTNLGWRGTASFFVPDACLPVGTVVLNNLDCGFTAQVTGARVELYDTTASGMPTISTLVFNPNSLIIDNLYFVAGELTQLSTTLSNAVDPIEDLSSFGVGSSTSFSLQFTLADGPRLAWANCAIDCTSGFNDPAVLFPFVIERVPEPATLALAALGLAGLLWSRRKPVLLTYHSTRQIPPFSSGE